MSQEEKKKKKKKQQKLLLENQEVQSKVLSQLVERLDELEKQKKYVDIDVCPKCKSPFVRQVGNMSGPPQLTSVLHHQPTPAANAAGGESICSKQRNKPTTVKDVVIVAEANDAAEKQSKKKRWFR